MKKIPAVIVIFLTVASSVLFSQETSITGRPKTLHSYGDFSISMSPNLITNTPSGTILAGGLKMRYFLSKHFSFDSELILGKHFAQFGPGLIGIPIWALAFNGNGDNESTLSELAAMAAMVMLSFEHTAYHIPLTDNTDLSPYISLLRFESEYRRGYLSKPDPNLFEVTMGVGVELNQYFNKLVISPYIEYNRAYDHPTPGINAGVYLGFFILRKK